MNWNNANTEVRSPVYLTSEYTQIFQHLPIQLNKPVAQEIDFTVHREVNDNLKSGSKCC